MVITIKRIELINVKYLEQSLAHSKCSLNASQNNVNNFGMCLESTSYSFFFILSFQYVWILFIDFKI